MILLDTCILLWLSADTTALSKTAIRSLRNPELRFFVSAISAYEIGQKAARKRLLLPCPVSEWFPAMLDRFQFLDLPITATIAAKATILPDIHNDPFDRLLVASALSHNLTLLTPDPLIQQYPGLQTLW